MRGKVHRKPLVFMRMLGLMGKRIWSRYEAPPEVPEGYRMVYGMSLNWLSKINEDPKWDRFKDRLSYMWLLSNFGWDWKRFGVKLTIDFDEEAIEFHFIFFYAEIFW